MTKDEAEIRGVLARFTDAIRNKDSAGAIAPLADDKVTFDLAPPLALGPNDTHDPAALEQWFGTWQGPIVSESRNLKIAAGGNVA